jgi:hypothetical protein
MNEIEIIRSQLALEQSHAAQVAHACAALFGSQRAAASSPEAAAALREAGVSYLVWALARFEERDQRLAEIMSVRESARGADAAASAREPPLAQLLSRSGRSREALSRLEGALAATDPEAARARWQEFARFFDSAWAPRRAALEQALTRHGSLDDWRAVGAIDADSILDERERHARVLDQLPAGLSPRAAAGPPASPIAP